MTKEFTFENLNLLTLTQRKRVKKCDDCPVYNPAICASCLGTGQNPVWMAHALIKNKESWARKLGALLQRSHAPDGACGDNKCCGTAYCCACSSVYPCPTINVLNSTDEHWRILMETGKHVPLSEGICPVCAIDGSL